MCGDQASFVKFSLAKTYQGVVGDAAHMFLGVTSPSFFSISTWKVIDQKYLKDNLS
jgi:hypothetical protein